MKKARDTNGFSGVGLNSRAQIHPPTATLLDDAILAALGYLNRLIRNAREMTMYLCSKVDISAIQVNTNTNLKKRDVRRCR